MKTYVSFRSGMKVTVQLYGSSGQSFAVQDVWVLHYI